MESVSVQNPAPEVPLDISPQLTRADVERILKTAYYLGASDVFFQTGQPVRMRVHGKNIQTTRRTLTPNELTTVVDSTVRSTSGAVMSGTPADYADVVSLDRVRVVNWRVNATACAMGARDHGIEVVFRAIPGLPPEIDSLGLPAGLRRAFTSHDGMRIVVGPTGSGKSTLLASQIRHMLETGQNYVVRTLEAPIEFTYDQVKADASNIISQSEVGRDVATFADGVANCLRRAPTDILIGEMRDRATIEAGILAAQTGHRVWTTAHAGSVSATIYRLVNGFDGDDKQMRIVEFVQNLRVIVVQHLVPKLSGGRIPIREWLEVNDEMRERLLMAPREELHLVAQQEVESRRQTMLDDVLRRLDNKEIGLQAATPYLESAKRRVGIDSQSGAAVVKGEQGNGWLSVFAKSARGLGHRLSVVGATR